MSPALVVAVVLVAALASAALAWLLARAGAARAQEAARAEFGAQLAA